MPSPRNNESQKDFVSRCMSDDKSNQSFPDQKQRVAFCNSQWVNKEKSSGAIYVYEDPQSGEVFHYSRRGKYRKNGRTLVYKGRGVHILNSTEENYLKDNTKKD